MQVSHDVEFLSTVKFCPVPSHGPVPAVVSTVQESAPVLTINMHPPLLGSHPRRAFASELFPLPVAPTIKILKAEMEIGILGI